MTTLARISMALSAVVLMVNVSWAAEGVRVNVERANLRAAAKADSAIVGKVTKGTVLPVLGREGAWVRVTAPGGKPAYISARVCEPATIGATAETRAPEPEKSSSPAPMRSRSGRSWQPAPLQLGGNVDFATSGVGLGVGIRASKGIPVIENLGALVTFDFLFGARSTTYAELGEIEASGHGLAFGLYPTYSYDFGDFAAYGGAGLAVLQNSWTLSMDKTALTTDVTGSDWFVSLGLVAGVKFKDRFFGEARYQLGGGSHLTLSVGAVFDAPF